MKRLLSVFRAALACGALGLLLLLCAIATAGLRFATCGPSRIGAPDASCALGVQLLLAAYVVLGVALVLGAISLSLLWRLRRNRRAKRAN